MDHIATFAGTGSGSAMPPPVQNWRQRASFRTSGAKRLSDTSSSDIKETTIEITELAPPEITHWPLPRTPTAGESLKRWPEAPVPITNDARVETFLLLFDVTLCMVPVALIVKAGLCVWGSWIDRDHKGASIDQTSQLTLKLVEFNSQLTTIFTIIFIIIVSTTLRRFALWRAERGATIGQLEQLQSSMSLAGTVKAIWSLRAFTLTSVGLICLWAWYYVGSQASTREYKYEDSGWFDREHIAFLGSQALSPYQDGSILTTSPVRKTDMTARYHMYNQFTAGSQNNATTDAKTINGADIFGNTLTPWFGPAYGQTWADLDFSYHGWLEIEHMSTQPVVSSIGPSLYRQILNNTDISADITNTWVPAKMIGSYQYETAYFETNCTAPTISSASAPAGLMPVLSTSFNMSTPANDTNLSRQLEMWHWVNSTHSLTSTCNMTYHSVEIKAVCTAATCKPHKIRLLDSSPRTLFDNDSFASLFFDSMLLACGTPTHPGDFTTFDNDNGLVKLRTLLQSNVSASDPRIPALISSSQFPVSMSITRFINTYFTSSQMLRYGDDFQNDLAVNGTIALSNNPDFTYLTMKGAKYEPQYVLYWPWLIADIISNFVLLKAAIISFWLRKRTLAPDIFGFVSSLTRDNPNFQLPEGGSTLSGIDRARRMKHVKVKIGDVGSHAGRDVGRVGIVYAGDMSAGIKDLEKGKVYY